MERKGGSVRERRDCPLSYILNTPLTGASPLGGLGWTCPPTFARVCFWDRRRSDEFFNPG